MDTVKVTRLKALQIENNLSLRELCEQTGLAKSTILHFYAGTKKLRTKNIHKLCDALSVPEDTDLAEIIEVPSTMVTKKTHTFD